MKQNLLLLAVLLAGSAHAAAAPTTITNTASPQARTLQEALDAAGYRFTSGVQTSYIALAKAEALASLADAGDAVPADFLAWIDSRPDIQATVYGARTNAAPVLRQLYALELDLGPEAVREQYPQFALALAVVHGKAGANADIRPRPRLELRIPGDPRKPVNTKDPTRPLDLQDHLINFLEDHAPIEEEVVVGHKEEPPELKYDARGIAIPAPTGKKMRKVPVMEKRKRALEAADVFASQALQDECNAYLAARGFTNRIVCGNGLISRNHHDMIRGPEAAGIHAAYQLFRAAYEAKGRLPAARDPTPTPSERMAYLMRNDRHTFTNSVKENGTWPRFPLNAPWPVLTLLAADNQPLRECEEIWGRFRDLGQMRTYGEYIGGIAQQFDFQSARRLAPFAFTYGTYQMMAKDGGVCGTMAGMGVRTYLALGIPACTAGQPGHCALIYFARDDKTGTYRCRGGQYATGGDAQTSPHGTWVFGDTDARRAMEYHQSIAWAVNAGFQEYLDSTVAYTLYRRWPAAAQREHGPMLLLSALDRNPYNILLADAAQAVIDSPQKQINAWQAMTGLVARAASRPGCPTNSLYATHLRSRLFARLAALPLPTDRTELVAVRDFLAREHCDTAQTMVLYQQAVDGQPALLAATRTALTNHLAVTRTRAARENDEAARFMADWLTAAGEQVRDKPARRAWAAELLPLVQGREKYFGQRYRIATDPVVPVLYRLAGQKPPAESQLVDALLASLAGELERSVAGQRDVANCRELAARIAAAGKVTKDPAVLAPWRERLQRTMSGREKFVPAGAKAGAKPVLDPCADAIAKLIPPAAAPTG